MNIERKYIVDDCNRRIAVQIDIDTFEKIEHVLEDYALLQLIKEADEEPDVLDLDQARNYYENLEKAKC
jgi:hypothetical protein